MRRFAVLAFLGALLWPGAAALAQSTATPVVPGQLTNINCPSGFTTCFVPSTPATPLEVVTTTFSSAASTTLSAGTTTSNVALPGNGSITEIANGGSVAAYVNLGVGSGTKATLTSMQVPAGWTVFVYTGNATYLAGITASSTATLTINSGNLIPISSGGGGPTSNVNVAQVNGITTLTGAGATGTGSQRVTVAQDTTTIAGSAPGTAGTASANVLSVQGVASMTPLLVGVGQASTTSGQSGVLTQCAVTTSNPSYTTAQTSPLSCDTGGNLRVTAPATAPVNVTVTAPPNDVSTGPSTCTTTGGCTAFTVNTQGSGGVGVTVAGSGAGMAFTFQGAVDSSTPTYASVPCSPAGIGGATVTSGSANGTWVCNVSGYKLFRLNWTGLSSGTVTETLNSSAGSAQFPTTVTVGGKNGSTNVPLNVTVNGDLSTIVAGFSSTNGSTTITSGGSFQTILASSSSRRGCLIQNPTTATEVLYVNVGGSDTTAKSYSLSPGLGFSCNFPGGVVTDKIDVEAATTGHAFVETDQ